MADAAKRSSANTQLYIGTLKASIGLFATKADPAKTAKFDTAGPNGGVLKYEQRGVAVPVGEEPEQALGMSDPLAAAHELEHAALLAKQAEDGDAFVREFGALAGGAFTQTEAERQAPVEPAGVLVDGEFRQVLVEEGSGQVVEHADVRRGVRRDDGAFVDCTDQLAAIDERTKLDRMEVVKCIDGTRIQRRRVIGSYFIGAQDGDAKAKLRLLYEALRERREVAVVKYTTRSRQQLGVIVPHAATGTLLLLSLVFAEDLRDAPSKATSIQKVQIPESQVFAMCKLLAALHGHVDDLDGLRDDAVALREELKVRALAGEMDASVVEPLPVPEETPDLMEALGASLEAVRAGKV